MALIWAHGFEGVVANGGTGLPPMTYSAGTVTFNTTFGRFGSTGINCSSAWQPLMPRSDMITIGSAIYCHTTATPSAANYIFYFIGDYNQTGHINVYRSANGAIEVRRGTAPGTIIASTGQGVMQIGAWYYIEVQVTIHDTTGVVIVRLNDQEVINFVGDTRNGGTDSTIDSIAMSGQSSIYYDDFYILDGTGPAPHNTFLGDIRISTLYPDSNGSFSQGLGSDANSTDNYLLVNEAVPSAANYIDLGVGEKDTYGYQNLSIGSPPTIYAVKQSSWLQKTSSGVITARNIARLSGVDVNDTVIYPTSSLSYDETFWTEKPGGGAWTEADVNAAEFGVEAL